MRARARKWITRPPETAPLGESLDALWENVEALARSEDARFAEMRKVMSESRKRSDASDAARREEIGELRLTVRQLAHADVTATLVGALVFSVGTVLTGAPLVAC